MENNVWNNKKQFIVIAEHIGIKKNFKCNEDGWDKYVYLIKVGKKIYTTISNGLLYGFRSNTLDLEKDISLYILEQDKDKKEKIKK